MNFLVTVTRSLRFLVFNILSWITVVPFALLVIVAWPFGHRYSYVFAHTWAILVLWMVKIICGLTYRVHGQENIPAESCVFFVKHSSAFETFGALALFPRNCWVLKKELMWVPFFGWGLIPLDAIPIDRSKGHEAVSQVITLGKDRLQHGISVVIYPEGTRMPVGQTKRYGISGVLLAQESSTKIVPVAHNAGYFWPRRKLAIKPGEITVTIGAPVDPAGREPRDVNQEIQDWVEATVTEIVANNSELPG